MRWGLLLALVCACGRGDADPPPAAGSAASPVSGDPPPQLVEAVQRFPAPVSSASAPSAVRAPPPFEGEAIAEDALLGCDGAGDELLVFERPALSLWRISRLERQRRSGSPGWPLAVGVDAGSVYAVRDAFQEELFLDIYDRNGEARSRRALPPFPAAHGADSVRRAWVLPRAKVVVYGRGGQLLIAALDDGRKLGELKLARGTASDVVAAPDGKSFAVATIDGLRIHAPTGELRSELGSPPAVAPRWLAWTEQTGLSSLQSESTDRRRVILEGWSPTERRRSSLHNLPAQGPVVAASATGHWLLADGAIVGAGGGARAMLEDEPPTTPGCALDGDIFTIRGRAGALTLVRRKDGAKLEIAASGDRLLAWNADGPVERARVERFLDGAGE